MMRYLKLGLLFLVVAMLQGCFFYQTKPNEVGVRTRKIGIIGKKGVEEYAYAPGSTYFFLPVLNDWHTFNTNLQNMEMTITEARGDVLSQDDLKFKTIDGNDISLDIIISYRINPDKAPYILSHVAQDDVALRAKVVRVIARSRPRDIFGELETEEFYTAELRAQKAEKAKQILNEILNHYGVIVERVLTKDYRFNNAYQQAIEDKKIADQKTEQYKSATKATEEEYKRKLEEAKGEVNRMVAEVNGQYEKAKISADAYFEKQRKLSEAIYAEARAESEGIRKLNEALAERGGKVMVKLEMAKALKGKKIILIPSSTGDSVDLKTMDLNKLIETKGVQTLSEKKGK